MDGDTSCVPCRHGYEMWHWPGSCSAWPNGGGGNSSSVSLTFSAASGLPERRHPLLVEGKESQNSQLFYYVKCLSVLGCFCQVIHLDPGEGIEGTRGWGWCPLEG